MTTNEILSDLGNKSFHKAAIAIRKQIEVQQLILETQWTDFLQSLVDFGNKHYLKNFQYSLVMEENRR